MPEETIKTSVCHKLRTEIYQMIFPRWALFIAGGLIISALLGVYSIASCANDKAKESASASTLLSKEFTLTVGHIKENQDEMKAEQKEQRTLLQKIDRRLNGGR